MSTLSEAAVQALPIQCREARDNHRDARDAVWKWERYLLIAGAILLVLIAVAAYFFTDNKVSEAALSTGAAIVDGAALTWIVGRRKAAEKNLRYWYGKVVAACPAEVDEEQRSIW